MTMREVLLQLLIKKPFYGYVASIITPVESTSVKTINMAVLPSLRVVYNPIWFDSLNDNQKTGAVIHELIHLILLHQFRIAKRNPNLWAIACDMAVNEHIEESMLNEDSITVAKIMKGIKRELRKNASAEYYYDEINKNEEITAFIGNDEDEIIISFDSDKDLKANRFSDESLSEMELKSLKNDLAQIVNDSSAEESIPNEVENIVDQVYEEFKINWRNVLKRFLSGHGRIQTRKSFKRVSRRFDNLPGTKRSIGVRAMLAIDESGSIKDDLVNKFYKELLAINKIAGAQISVSRFDTECTEPQPINEYIKNNSRMKRGGTNFKPVFQMADKHRFPLLIIFTDGDGDAPESANQNTLWVIKKGGKKPNVIKLRIKYFMKQSMMISCSAFLVFCLFYLTIFQ